MSKWIHTNNHDSKHWHSYAIRPRYILKCFTCYSWTEASSPQEQKSSTKGKPASSTRAFCLLSFLSTFTKICWNVTWSGWKAAYLNWLELPAVFIDQRVPKPEDVSREILNRGISGEQSCCLVSAPPALSLWEPPPLLSGWQSSVDRQRLICEAWMHFCLLRLLFHGERNVISRGYPRAGIFFLSLQWP